MFLHTPQKISSRKRQPLQFLALLSGAFALLAFAWRSPLIQHELQHLSGADIPQKASTDSRSVSIQAVQNDSQPVCLPGTEPEARLFSQVSGCRANSSAAEFRLPFDYHMSTTNRRHLSETPAGRVFDNPAQSAYFPGGKAAIQEFVNKNLHYPVEAARKGIEGKVYTQFVIERDGAVSQVRILKGIDQELDEEAVRIVRAMPKWNPGVHKHFAVRSYVRMPIIFKLVE